MKQPDTGISRARLRIVLVEDDLNLLEGWKDLFDLLGHEVVCQSRALSALKDSDSIKDCHVLISDYYLPDVNGVDLIKRAREINPTMKTILLTGSREPAITEAAQKIPGCTLLYKPLNIDEIEARLLEFASGVESR